MALVRSLSALSYSSFRIPLPHVSYSTVFLHSRRQPPKPYIVFTIRFHIDKEYCIESRSAVDEACTLLQVSRAAYYKWVSGRKGARTVENEAITEKIKQIHMESPDKGYRRINDDLCHDYDIHINDKRVLRICRKKDIKSTIKYSNHGCTRRAKNPQYIGENVLNRDFHAKAPNEKWLTDVTEFKWYEGVEVHKVYLSAILDIYDRRIVSFVIGDRNDNPLVFKTFDKAVKENPDAHPIFHSDRDFQYTSRTFHSSQAGKGGDDAEYVTRSEVH